jgi:ACT domain-containing protein
MSKKIVTEADIEALAKDGVVEVVRGMIVTPLAREHASRKGIRLVYGGGSVPSAEDIPRDPGTGRKGPPEEALRQTVAEEVARLLSQMPDAREASIPSYSPLAAGTAATALAEAAAEEPARCVVVATGLNRPGIAATLSASISECGADIQDISQTIVSEFFSMIFVVNIENLGCGLTFRGFKEKVEAAGRTIGAECVVFHEAILRAMHRV